jgi:hypothetical protein
MDARRSGERKFAGMAADGQCRGQAGRLDTEQIDQASHAMRRRPLDQEIGIAARDFRPHAGIAWLQRAILQRRPVAADRWNVRFVRSGKRIDPGQLPANDQLIDLSRAIRNGQHARIAEMPFKREFLRNPERAVHLDRLRCDALRGLGRK